jgi:alpha,alpha-trehalase
MTLPSFVRAIVLSIDPSYAIITAEPGPGSGRGTKNRRLRFDGAAASLVRMKTLATSAAALMFGAMAWAEETPQQTYGELYRAVENAQLFGDSKEFADAVPRTAPAAIMADYRRQHPQDAAALKAFVSHHFVLPAEAAVPIGAPDRRPLAEHIDVMWPHLVRRTHAIPPHSSLIALPYPYVVPGGRFREIYYWDSYFTMLGLAEAGRHDLVRDMVKNFAHLIDGIGHIPNGNRSYYLSRSQPPFFFAMVALTEPGDPAKAYAAYLPQLKAEYRYWMDGAGDLAPGKAHRRVVVLADGTLLNRYWDDSDRPRDESFREDEAVAAAGKRPAADVYRNLRAAAESGWDFSTRWFADGHSRASIVTTEIVPVDLNSLLYGLEDAIRQGCERRHDPCAAEFAVRAAKRKEAINRYLWDPQLATYADYRWTERRFTGVLSAASFYPLYFGLADPERAKSVAAVGTRLVKPGGLVATTVATGEQWDAPNGWAPLQWMAVGGLRRYQLPLADTIACRWLANVDAVYRQSGKLVEKYDVENLNRPGGGGEYKTQDGFGWTNGVTRKLLTLYPACR